jgi:tRNA(Ile)-lysidine synthase
MKKKYIAGVSGGPDSMAMLYRYRHKITLVCHVNYHKRKSALRDQKIVEKFCHSNHIPLKVLSVTQKLYDEYKKKSKNFQTLARLIRYDFFVKCAKRAKCEKLLIAHNADDFCETAMMQQLKKSKALFYGIKSKSHYQDLIIVRPLIHFRKVTLLEYCRHKKIPYGIDESNLGDDYLRNRLRKKISK